MQFRGQRCQHGESDRVFEVQMWRYAVVNATIAVYVYGSGHGTGLRDGESDERAAFFEYRDGSGLVVLHECSGGECDGVSHESGGSDVEDEAVKKPP